MSSCTRLLLCVVTLSLWAMISAQTACTNSTECGSDEFCQLIDPYDGSWQICINQCTLDMNPTNCSSFFFTNILCNTANGECEKISCSNVEEPCAAQESESNVYFHCDDEYYSYYEQCYPIDCDPNNDTCSQYGADVYCSDIFYGYQCRYECAQDSECTLLETPIGEICADSARCERESCNNTQRDGYCNDMEGHPAGFLCQQLENDAFPICQPLACETTSDCDVLDISNSSFYCNLWKNECEPYCTSIGDSICGYRRCYIESGSIGQCELPNCRNHPSLSEEQVCGEGQICYVVPEDEYDGGSIAYCTLRPCIDGICDLGDGWYCDPKEYECREQCSEDNALSCFSDEICINNQCVLDDCGNAVNGKTWCEVHSDYGVGYDCYSYSYNQSVKDLDGNTIIINRTDFLCDDRTPNPTQPQTEEPTPSPTANPIITPETGKVNVFRVLILFQDKDEDWVWDNQQRIIALCEASASDVVCTIAAVIANDDSGNIGDSGDVLVFYDVLIVDVNDALIFQNEVNNGTFGTGFASKASQELGVLAVMDHSGFLYLGVQDAPSSTTTTDTPTKQKNTKQTIANGTAGYHVIETVICTNGSSTGTTEAQFYEQLFRTFDPQNAGTVQGGQVFGFFLSSGLNKVALGDVWDAATQKQSGGLTLQKFINAMKLISLCQKGIAPTLPNIAQHAPVPIPQMQYPSHVKLPTGTAAPVQSGSQSQPAQQAQPAADDPFGGLTQGLGFDIGSAASSSNNNLAGGNKPSVPNWTADGDALMTPTTTGGGGGGGVVDNISIHNEQHQSPQFGPPAVASTNGAMMNDMNLNGNVMGNGAAVNGNEYAPPIPPRQVSVTVDNKMATPSIDRRISTKILYQEERLREQIRQAEEREKLAKKQANTQRIENERLERENEQLKIEINTARQAQADALKQSQDAFSSIKPLQTENEKLKQAITAWKELIQTKDEELEALEGEVDQLRLENEKLENLLRDDKSKVDDVQFKLERADALLQDLKKKNREYETQIEQLREDNVKLEDEKRSLDLRVAQIKDEMKKLKRNMNSGLGINDKSTLMQKEQSLFNINDISFGGGSSSSNKKKNNNNETSSTQSQNEDDILSPGSHDFNFSEPGNNGPAADENAMSGKDDDNEFGPSNMGIGFIDDQGFDKNNNDKRKAAAGPGAAGAGDDNNDDDVDDEEQDSEPDMIDKEVEEKVEVEEDVVQSVLIDEEYQSSEWYLSAQEVKSYRKFFLQADANNDGVVDGGEANKFFTKSKLNRKLLAKIWVLADQDKKGKLNEAMFCVMFHIVMKIKKSGGKLQVPSQLPECLTVAVVEKLGTKIEKTVKQKKWVTKKKTIKVPNPNKSSKSKRKKKSKKKSQKKKAAPPPLPDDGDTGNATQKMDDFAADWGNDFAFDATESSTATNTNSPPQQQKQTQPAAITDDNTAADDNWNAFGEFFDGQT